jgi:peptidoglycan/LPS O-acetylase OafA/YrhL
LNVTKTCCLQCGSTRVHRSRRRSAIEYAIALAGWRVRRCHDCNTRFLQFGRSLVRASHLKRVGKKLLYAALAAAAVGLVVAAILWFGHSQTPASPVEGLFVPSAATAPIGG